MDSVGKELEDSFEAVLQNRRFRMLGKISAEECADLKLWGLPTLARQHSYGQLRVLHMSIRSGQPQVRPPSGTT
jgi:hypothetical protein